ncbi:MAG TPA: cell division protein SepF [Desulfosporosinus sp.]|nr:cell division protein SepF [Desulfosporosinus sp.]
MSKLLNTAFEFMGFVNAEEHDGYRIETLLKENKEDVVPLQPHTSQPTVVHIVPKAFNEVMDIATSLRYGEIVTMNLALVDEALRNEILDFASGSVYAFDGGLMKLGDNVYLLAGQGVTLQDKKGAPY